MVILRWLFIYLALIGTNQAVGAELSARLDRNQIALGESITLTIEVQRQDALEPDITPLERDFQIASSNRSSRINIINGDVEASTQFSYMLLPKRSGNLTIPQLRVGNKRTTALQVRVTDAPQISGNGEGRDLFIEVAVEPTRPYLQAQVIYSVRVFQAIDLREASLAKPETTDLMALRLGDDVQYEARRQGRRYRVTERRYALFPQRSGQIKVPAPVFEAQVTTGRAGLSFDPFNLLRQSSYRPIRIAGEEKLLDVQAPPTSAGNLWLPAQAFELQQSWSPEGGSYRVGEPITRTITMKAQGLQGEQLPELPESRAIGFRSYSDQPQIETTATNGAFVIGKRIEKVAIVPSQAGEIELPAISVTWWDTQSHQLREAKLPARTIRVLAASGEALPPPTPMGETASSPNSSPVSPALNTIPLEPSSSSNNWYSYILFSMWLVTLAGWWWERRRRLRAAQPEITPPRELSHKRLAKRIQSACTSQDIAAVRDALLSWAAHRWPDRQITNLGELADLQCDSQAVAVLQQLDRALYSKDTAGINTKDLWPRLKTMLAKHDRRAAVTSDLAPLYAKG